MVDHTEDVQRLIAHIDKTLVDGVKPTPGGWRNEVEIALIDAVFSARSSYGLPSAEGRGPTGVHRVIEGYRDLRRPKRVLDDLNVLIETMSQLTMRPFHAINRQRVPGRSPDRLTKWQAVKSVATYLSGAGAVSSDGVRHMRERESTTADLKRAFTRTPGVGDVTFNYFLILLGEPRVKADVMIRSFVARALGLRATKNVGAEYRVSAERAAALVMEAAAKLRVNTADLDHTIWSYERVDRQRRRTARRSD